MKYFSLILLLITFAIKGFATHNRAGEITYKQISNLKYQITIVTYTYTLSAADRPELDVEWGDNTSSVVYRTQKIALPDYYQRNVYIGEHTFPGPGVYEIVMMDRNRNDGVKNIPNSVNKPFTIKTTFQINPDLGGNSTPILLTEPIDKARVGEVFIHNPSAYDFENDSISYKLTKCLGEDGNVIPGYTYPPASHTLYVDSITGDLVWDSPTTAGIYNVAMLIEEWRKGVKISKIVRDIQIEVLDALNHAPKITPLQNICVEAGTTVNFDVYAYDQDNDNITLTATGGPFQSSPPANFSITQHVSGYTSGNFNWETTCDDVSKQPHQVEFKAEDDNSEVKLVDYKTVRITVVSPAPENLALDPTNNSIDLTWDPCICSNADGYDIYRRKDYYGYVHSQCETGVPAYTGYVKIAHVNGYSNTSFLDNDNGNGLQQGYVYCYMVVATFTDGAESYASDEVCSPLVQGIPLITMVSVDSTSQNSGIISIDWAKPKKFDTIPGNYDYKIYRSNGIWGQNLHYIATNTGIDDTTFIDYNLNTKDSAYSYKIEFYKDNALIGSPQVASSIFEKITSGDNKIKLDFEKNVPWINTNYVIYKYNDDSLRYDSIGITNNSFYTDSNLINGKEYCYKVKSYGKYFIQNIKYPLINYSQENCGIPIDTTPPCPPVLKVDVDCDLFENHLIWTNPNNYCCDDVIKYNVYFSPTLNGNLELINTTDSQFDTTFTHAPTESMAGCYAVSAVDSFYNESIKSEIICVDQCTYYQLPNIFSPNGDNINDLFKPGPYKFVDHIDMQIFDRWGVLVFKTDNPDINWDGKNMYTNKMVTDGVYYYVCDVYEYRLTGIEPRNLVGFIQVANGNDKANPK